MISFLKRKKERVCDQTFWMDVARTTIANRPFDKLHEGAADAMAIAAISAQECGAPLEKIIDAIAATYKKWAFYIEPERGPVPYGRGNFRPLWDGTAA